MEGTSSGRDNATGLTARRFFLFSFSSSRVETAESSLPTKDAERGSAEKLLNTRDLTRRTQRGGLMMTMMAMKRRRS